MGNFTVYINEELRRQKQMRDFCEKVLAVVPNGYLKVRKRKGDVYKRQALRHVSSGVWVQTVQSVQTRTVLRLSVTTLIRKLSLIHILCGRLHGTRCSLCC